MACQNNTASVMLGNGDGTFHAPVISGLGIWVALGDFNRDGRTDLAVTNNIRDNVSVLLGQASANSLITLTTVPATTVAFGEPLSLTATVVGVAAFSSPSGIVNFRDGSTVLRTESLVNGITTFSADGLASGPHMLYADYLGDATTSPSNSSAVPLTVTGGPLWTISKLNNGNLTQGQIGASYTITVTNTGVVPSIGTVSVTEMPRSGLTIASMSGPGWTCSVPTCTRSDGLISKFQLSSNHCIRRCCRQRADSPDQCRYGIRWRSRTRNRERFSHGRIRHPAIRIYRHAPKQRYWNRRRNCRHRLGLERRGSSPSQSTANPSLAKNSNGLIFIGNAAIIPGARPDIAQQFPGYPNNNSGWGFQLLTNELPNNTGQSGLGNGTYNLHVLVTDNASQQVDLGIRTITVNNAISVLPFGTVDTPTQGGTASGTTFVNFGWALTPNPNIIPIDGSSIWVFIDNLPVGHPVYNNYRADIASLFPGLQNSMGAVGYYYIDTTTLSNGLHTISSIAPGMHRDLEVGFSMCRTEIRSRVVPRSSHSLDRAGPVARPPKRNRALSSASMSWQEAFMPFDPLELADHFRKHRADFNVSSDKQYEVLADRFLASPIKSTQMECVRQNGDRIRYDMNTRELGVISRAGVIRTYFKPRPCAGLVRYACHAIRLLTTSPTSTTAARNEQHLSGLRVPASVASNRLPHLPMLRY